MLPSGDTEKVAEAFSTKALSKRSNDISAVQCRQHPKTAFTLRRYDVRSADKVPIFESAKAVFTGMAKDYSNASSGHDEYTAKISSDRPVKALVLSFRNALEVKMGESFPVVANFDRISHIVHLVLVC